MSKQQKTTSDTEVERRRAETQDESVRFLREWRERALERMRTLHARAASRQPR